MKIKKFDSPIYVTRPILPSLAEFKKMVGEIWECGLVTNSGPKHQRFERELVNFLKVPHVSAVVNGHSAIEVALRALNLKGEVITTPFTFPSTSHAITLNGLHPVFCDIDKNTYNISIKNAEELITDKTSAILAVHVFGNPCDTDGLAALSSKYGLKLIYDAAHAFGVETGGKGIGQYGDMSAFSLHATKVFNSMEGGLVTYSDPKYQPAVQKLRNFGYAENSSDEDVSSIGSNMKMSELHAAVGLLNLNSIDEKIEERRLIYTTYLERIKVIKGLSLIDPYADKPNYSYCPILVESSQFGMNRDELASELVKYNVHARKYFFPACNDLSCYKSLASQRPTPIAKDISSRILCLPIFPGLPQESTNKICDILMHLST